MATSPAHGPSPTTRSRRPQPDARLQQVLGHGRREHPGRPVAGDPQLRRPSPDAGRRPRTVRARRATRSGRSRHRQPRPAPSARRLAEPQDRPPARAARRRSGGAGLLPARTAAGHRDAVEDRTLVGPLGQLGGRAQPGGPAPTTALAHAQPPALESGATSVVTVPGRHRGRSGTSCRPRTSSPGSGRSRRRCACGCRPPRSPDRPAQRAAISAALTCSHAQTTWPYCGSAASAAPGARWCAAGARPAARSRRPRGPPRPDRHRAAAPAPGPPLAGEMRHARRPVAGSAAGCARGCRCAAGALVAAGRLAAKTLITCSGAATGPAARAGQHARRRAASVARSASMAMVDARSARAAPSRASSARR